ncbi:NADH dehydrogenase (quinone) [Anaeromyxobacter dehalogenans 2CP-1]|uniref:NADH-quinone oxidoreductase subunit H n=1 Tax=Anaeromyxobacter dehalogenans (strain ATCC BAA-258 / DSM 21875 / 2CP-1) TaxID=455488 RepID=B8JH16_ANAD2|nr:complex I subunit 1 family protein [Anaeromyxobacter dehalogenans]ACL64718.1 NADH dehydrogenase (quinone) [Anaeromyxobacter dehalogenans 2CP-1]
MNAPAIKNQDLSKGPGRTARGVVLATLAVGFGLPTILLGAVLVLSPLSKPAMLAAALRAAGVDVSGWSQGGRYALWLVAMAVLALILVSFGAVISGMTVWWEMRVSARMQSRIGYNRVGAAGFFQWIADAVKLLLKEDLIPAEADRLLFRAAPYFVMVGFALVFVALPFGESLIAADLNVGIFYITAVTALIVVGILIAGWSSNSKWALFGGMRSAAQVISYEIPAGLAVMVPVLMSGTLSMQGIIRSQGAWPWEWHALTNPFALVAFGIFFVAQLAEGNRTPFDLPEAESELVAGYLSEYSAFRFALFFLVEFGNLWVMSAISVTLFFGGWQVPFAGPEVFAAARGAGDLPGLAWWGLQLASMLIFVAKTLVLLNVVVWVRWTLPRIRVDQMMSLCWKYLVPFAFVCFVATLLWQILVTRVPATAPVIGGLMVAAAVVAGFFFLRLTRRNISAVGDRVDFTNW